MEKYYIKFTEKPIDCFNPNNNKIWEETEVISLCNYMGDRPGYFPNVFVKLRYDKNNIYVLFMVKEKNVIAVSKNHFDPVFEDSCVEFFFSPDIYDPEAYFNLEVNCSGKVLFGYRKNKSQKSIRISIEDINSLEVNSTFKNKTINEEIKEEIDWFVSYKIPFSLIEKYSNKPMGNLKNNWRVNFYKCADKSSNPHWLTWNKVINPVPNFHLPEHFGELVF
ncbi:MAG TPA: carbohydrate-binding family 9-like protein [Melioribacteraceae bacterium]|nr:carbohydrate-binding family 9-like protein [Melioribacteraceae bacterium]